MRVLVCLSFVFLTISTGNAQVGKEFSQHNPRMIAYGTLPEDPTGEDVQKNFINQTWRDGKVFFRNSSDILEAPLIFDLYSNQLYFLKDGRIMEFTQPIKQFTLTTAKQGSGFLYRAGYPAIHQNTDETFYEVLVDGNFQLLKCKAKTIGLYKDYDLPEEKRTYTKELLYALLPDGKIILVKKDKDYLLKEMAAYTTTIETICSDKKLKLKNETQLKELFAALNEVK